MKNRMNPLDIALITLAQSETVGAFIDNSINLAWLEIARDVKEGRVPHDVPNFSALHDYVDANEYGGLCDDKVLAVALHLMPKDEDEEHEILGSFAFAHACNVIQSTINQMVKARDLKA